MTLHYQIDNEIFSKYVKDIDAPSEILNIIEEYNDSHVKGRMMMDPVQMRFICWLANLVGAKNYLEVGVFTGYSSTAMGLSLPDDAQLYLCDISVDYTNQAKKFWQLAGIVHKVKLFLQPALISLHDFLQENKQDFFDFVLLDADKAILEKYVESSYPLLRTGGVIAIDNVYQRGKVAKNACDGDSLSLQTMRRFNHKIVQDSRFDVVMLPLGDGLTLLTKK